MQNIIVKTKRSLLAMGLVLGLGMGVASALESSYVTASSVPMVVKPVPPRPVQYYTPVVSTVYSSYDCGCDQAPTVVYSAPTVVYSAPTVVYSAPTVVYRSEPRVVRRVVSAPRVVESRPVVSTPLCTSCR